MNPTRKRFRIVLLCAVIAVVGVVGAGFNRWHSSDLQAGETDLTLLGSVQAVATLHRLYPIFTDPAQRQGMTLQQLQAVETEFQQQLQLVPMELLLPQMEKYSVAYASQVNAFADPQGFVGRLSRVAMNGIITPTVAEKPAQGAISFKPAAAYPEDVSTFAASSKTIFAVFDSSAYRDTRVLVKWYHTSSGRIVLFRQYEIADSASNYIWIDNKNGFENGNYRVEIYRVNEALSLLSSGEYQVTE
jgi:hypothetical protein